MDWRSVYDCSNYFFELDNSVVNDSDLAAWIALFWACSNLASFSASYLFRLPIIYVCAIIAYPWSFIVYA